MKIQANTFPTQRYLHQTVSALSQWWAPQPAGPSTLAGNGHPDGCYLAGLSQECTGSPAHSLAFLPLHHTQLQNQNPNQKSLMETLMSWQKEFTRYYLILCQEKYSFIPNSSDLSLGPLCMGWEWLWSRRSTSGEKKVLGHITENVCNLKRQ